MFDVPLPLKKLHAHARITTLAVTDAIFVYLCSGVEETVDERGAGTTCTRDADALNPFVVFSDCLSGFQNLSWRQRRDCNVKVSIYYSYATLCVYGIGRHLRQLIV